MKFLIVTGLSGAGKTSVLRHLEDSGYQCMDNIPPLLLAPAFTLCEKVELDTPVALGVDSRSGALFDADAVCSAIDQGGDSHEISILFLEADTETLIDRYKETRRDHPLMRGGMTLEQAIANGLGIQISADAGNGENVFRNHSAADGAGKAHADLGHDGDHAVAQGMMTDDRLVGCALGLGGTDVVLPDNVQHTGAAHTDHGSHGVGTQNQRRQNQGLGRVKAGGGQPVQRQAEQHLTHGTQPEGRQREQQHRYKGAAVVQ